MGDNMNAKIIIALMAAALGTAGVAQVVNMPKMRYTLHVIGEDGKPIPGVKTASSFNKDAISYGQKIQVSATTDDNGNFTAEGYSDDGKALGKLMSKDGYFDSGVSAGPFEIFENGHWLPWDQTYTTVLRKIGTPIPLYVKRMNATIPVTGTPCGYDLEVADWVAPYGKGKVTDYIVTVTNLQYRSDNDSEISATVTFPNDGDGIQEIQLPKEFANSVFKWPRLAPEAGYLPQLETHRLWLNVERGHTQSIDTANENQAYFVRVRTVKQGGKIVSALYGKILGGIGVGPNGGKNGGVIGFTYYLNPTSLDRNLEFSGNTLFKDLPQSETTHVP